MRKELRERALRWEPVRNIPEAPIAEFSLESCHLGELTLTLKHPLITGNHARDLMLIFSDARAFRTYWDGDAVLLNDDRPRCQGTRFADYIWPLLVIENSRWIASSGFVGFGPFSPNARYRHYRVLALDRRIDIVATDAISAEWIVAEATEVFEPPRVK